MIRPVGNQKFYKTLLEQQIAETATRNRTSWDIGKIILENNKRLCNEINEFNKVSKSADSFVYALNSAGEFIKSVKGAGMDVIKKVSDGEIIKLIEKIRAVK